MFDIKYADAHTLALNAESESNTVIGLSDKAELYTRTS